MYMNFIKKLETSANRRDLSACTQQLKSIRLTINSTLERHTTKLSLEISPKSFQLITSSHIQTIPSTFANIEGQRPEFNPTLSAE